MLKDYVEFTKTTAIYPKSHAVEYCAYGLASEVGEVLGKLKKHIRDQEYDPEGMMAEMGDVFWYWVRLCDELNIDVTSTIKYNMAKLQARKQKGTIKGSGDAR